MREPKFATWTASECPFEIEYSLSVIDEIRAMVTEGFQRLSRGGIEVGGILYGIVEGNRIRIEAMRQIACEHASGPTFKLSGHDQVTLTKQLQEEGEDFRRQDLAPVGWFVSHTRSEIALQQVDLDTYNTYFPEPWQVTLVVRPGRAGSMRAGFFLREPDGSLKAERSYQDFLFPERQPLVMDRPVRERSPFQQRPESRPEQAYIAPEPGNFAPPKSIPYSSPEPPEYEYAPYPDRHRRIPWAVIGVIAAAVVVAILGLRYFGDYMNAEPISLAVSERDGQLQIQWDGSSSTITRASSGTLEITDGPQKQNLALTPKELTTGTFTYARKTGDVQVRMIVTGSGGQKEEGSRYLGKAPENAEGNEMDLMKVEKDALQDEVTRLRQQDAAQTERIRQLERTLTVMRTRMGISQGGR